MLKPGDNQRNRQGGPPERAAVPAATEEEAERAITRLLAEWELRVRRLRVEGSTAPPGLSSRFGSPQAVVAHERVIERLAALGPAALEPLARALRVEATESLALGRAAIAARALGRMGDFRAAPALLAALRDQRESAAVVRGAAALALGALKAEAAATLYEQALARRDNPDWQAELENLGALHLETVVEALVEALRDAAPLVRAAAADACVDLCLAEPPALMLTGQAGPPVSGAADTRPAVSAALALAVEPLSAALQDEHAAVRASAASALGWIGDLRAAAPLAHCLEDDDEDCRAAAAWALGMLRSPVALKPLARALGDASKAVRQQVAEALGQVGDPITFDLLLDALTDVEEALEVRAAAARALGQLHLPQALTVFQELLYAPQPALRMAAVEALGHLGFGRAYRLLTPLLWHDPDRAVRHAAARALARLAQARQRRARWRLRLALRVAGTARQEALALLDEHRRHVPQALRD
ncbi:MAG TPA: HEAT repeat domain-containing protein [Ktedonobacterales bacterium]